MAKNNDNLTITIIIVVAIVFLISQGYIGKETPSQKNETPNPNAIFSSCQQVCSANSFSKFYDFTTSCKAGETKITYNYPNQPPLLTCCCYNAPTQQPNTHTCTETDGGNVKETPGTLTYDGTPLFTDSCVDATTVNEYWCLADGTWQGGRQSCDPGQTCIQSRSGGYCKTRVWNEGDTVFEGGGVGTVVGGQEGFTELDLGDYGLATGGNCQLGAIVHADWDYANLKCVGIMGTTAMRWRFYDSTDLEYDRTDTTPQSWTVDLHPRGHILNWDGHTNWRAYANQIPGMPECVINYNYNIKVYIYDCL